MSDHKNPVPVALTVGERDALKAIRIDVELCSAEGSDRESYENFRECVKERLEGLGPDERVQVVAALAWIGASCLKFPGPQRTADS